MNTKKTIVLVLRSGKDFSFRDVELITRHIHGRWEAAERPRIICLWDNASKPYDLGNIEILPLVNDAPGTWSRIALYSPEMEQYRPFLYVDLDTAIITSLERVFDAVKDSSQFITLEDFWQKGQLATGLVWFPAKSSKITKIWEAFKSLKQFGARMDAFIRNVTSADAFWQQLLPTIHDFKPKRDFFLSTLPADADVVCFHGKPRIFQAVSFPWVKEYVETVFTSRVNEETLVTVIIPYNKDRGWLKDAIASVPEGVQVILSKGDGNWPENFNKVLDQVKGRYVRWLHEDDMLTPNCIEDSVKTFEAQDVDFIHGRAIEIYMTIGRPSHQYIPGIARPTVNDLLQRNVLHSATMMYKREVFEKVGKMNESLNTAEEFEFNLRCLKAGMKIGYCATPLAFYRRHPQQKVRVVPEVDKKREREQVKELYK